MKKILFVIGLYDPYKSRILLNMEIDKFILRTPLLKLSDLVTSEEELLKKYKKTHLREALFIASPTLYTKCSSIRGRCRI
jgi:hypothetical protein